MKEQMTKVLANLALLVVGTLLGAVVQNWRAEAEKKLRYLDVLSQPRDEMFSRPEIKGQELEILLNKKPIKNLSVVDISVYNLSDRDYENVPFFIDPEPISDTPVEVITREVAGARGLREAVDTLPQAESPSTPGAVRYGYQVKTLNRSQGLDPVFRARYLVLGEKSPKVRVRTSKAGLDLRDFSFERSYATSWTGYLILFLLALGVVLVYISLLWVARRYNRKKIVEHDKKLRDALAKSLSEPERYRTSDAPLDTSKLASEVIFIFQKVRWDNAPRLARWISGMPEPEDQQTSRKNA